MRPHEAAALSALRTAFGGLVAYTGAGLNGGFVTAIKSDVEADPYQGLSGKARRVTFEIARSALPGSPANGNGIVEADGAKWKVSDVGFSGEVDSHILTVERTA